MRSKSSAEFRAEPRLRQALVSAIDHLLQVWQTVEKELWPYWYEIYGHSIELEEIKERNKVNLERSGRIIGRDLLRIRQIQRKCNRACEMIEAVMAKHQGSCAEAETRLSEAGQTYLPLVQHIENQQLITLIERHSASQFVPSSVLLRNGEAILLGAELSQLARYIRK